MNNYIKLSEYAKKNSITLNILRKEVPNAFNNTNGIEVCSMPSVFTVKL